MSQRIKTIGWVLIVLGIWGYVQDLEYTEQREYTKALERTLAKCLSGGDNPLVIGDRLFMCGSVDTGIEVKI